MHFRLDAFQFCIKRFFVTRAELVQGFSLLFVESLIYSSKGLRHEEMF